MSNDPIGFRDIHSFNRYAYANNNPYKYTDPTGMSNDLITAKEQVREDFGEEGVNQFNDSLNDTLGTAAKEGAIMVATGGLLNVAVKGAQAVRAVRAVKGAKETVQRSMSKAELSATQKTGLLRGGREGEHFVSNAVNSSSKRATQRLALPVKPEVRVTMNVSKGVFSSPSKVQPAFGMPGGGMERTAIGKVAVEIIKVTGMK